MYYSNLNYLPSRITKEFKNNYLFLFPTFSLFNSPQLFSCSTQFKIQQDKGKEEIEYAYASKFKLTLIKEEVNGAEG